MKMVKNINFTINMMVKSVNKKINGVMYLGSET